MTLAQQAHDALVEKLSAKIHGVIDLTRDHCTPENIAGLKQPGVYGPVVNDNTFCLVFADGSSWLIIHDELVEDYDLSQTFFASETPIGNAQAYFGDRAVKTRAVSADSEDGSAKTFEKCLDSAIDTLSHDPLMTDQDTKSWTDDQISDIEQIVCDALLTCEEIPAHPMDLVAGIDGRPARIEVHDLRDPQALADAKHILAILDIFHPLVDLQGTTWIYNDDHTGRKSGYDGYEAHMCHIAPYPASAHERLSARSRLTKRLRRRGETPDFIEKLLDPKGNPIP